MYSYDTVNPAPIRSGSDLAHRRTDRQTLLALRT
jgi:hypothetical protein